MVEPWVLLALEELVGMLLPTLVPVRVPFDPSVSVWTTA
jgi:hypothetical protein